MANKDEFYLKAWRNFRGLTQQQLANQSGTTKGYVSLIETRKSPYSQKWLTRFAAALEISPQQLFSPPPAAGALSDRGRDFDHPGTATTTDRATDTATDITDLDRDLMLECIKNAVRFIAKRRELRGEAAINNAADDAAEAALAAYLSYFRHRGEDAA